MLKAECTTPAEVVDLFARTFFSVSLTDDQKLLLADQLARELGGEDVAAAATYMEEPLRKLLHSMLSLPEYQLG